MPTSEQSRPAPDEVMREVVCQFADSAPLAPDWESLSMSASGPTPQGGHARRNLALVAAVTLLVVAGLWWIASPEPEVPADVPIVTVPPTSENVRSEARLSDLGPIEAQLCLSRKNVRLLVAHEAQLVEPDDGLAGYTPSRARLALFAPPVNAYASMRDHPDLDAGTATRIGEIVELFQMADALAFGGEGAAEAPEIAAALDELVTVLAADVESASDPALCSVDDDVASDADTGRSYGRCVAAVRLDTAFGQLGDTAGDADVDLAIGSAIALRAWYDRPPVEIVDLVTAAEDLRDLPPDRRPEAAAAARQQLAPLWSNPASPCAGEFVEP